MRRGATVVTYGHELRSLSLDLVIVSVAAVLVLEEQGIQDIADRDAAPALLDRRGQIFRVVA